MEEKRIALLAIVNDANQSKRTTLYDAVVLLLLNNKEVAKTLGICERLVRGMSSSGQLPKPVKVRGRTLWKRSEIVSWVDKL